MWGDDGRLRSYRSTNFGSAARLRAALGGLIAGVPAVEWVVMEGSGRYADLWEREALRRGLGVRRLSAERWREILLLPRERRRSRVAKHNAELLARRVIAWSGAPRPTSLTDDAAEAILVGLWAVLEFGWLPALPALLRGGVGRRG